MANVQDLQVKLEKAEAKVEKCSATIVRHQNQLAKKVTAFEKKTGITLDIENQEQIDSLKWTNGTGTQYYWDLCEIESKKDDIKGARKKLREAQQIASNWNDKLQAEIDKEKLINETAPQVIIDFLNQWKEMAYEWYIRRYNEYQDFKKKLDEEEAQAKIDLGISQYRMTSREQDKALKELGLDWKSIQARKADFAGAIVQRMDMMYKKEEREQWLDKTLEADKKAKLLDLINRITSVTGVITNASGLRISVKGNLDGIVVGERGKAKVETIGAGGWNIQCFHYRTLVNKLK